MGAAPARAATTHEAARFMMRPVTGETSSAKPATTLVFPPLEASDAKDESRLPSVSSAPCMIAHE
jgi:hypothetical protein